MNDDRDPEGRALATLLHSAEVPAARVDIGAAVAAGRRQRRRARFAGSAVAAVALATAGTVTAAWMVAAPAGEKPAVSRDWRVVNRPVQASCRVVRLPAPAGLNNPSVSAVDPTGRYVAGRALAGGDYPIRPVLWTGGRPVVIPEPGGLPVAVNAGGVVVGITYAENGGAARSWVYRDGKVSRLPGLPGLDEVRAGGINAKGEVAGTVNDGRGGFPGLVVTRAVRWPAGGGAPVVLAAPEYATAEAILDDGTVLGGLFRPGGTAPVTPTAPTAPTGRPGKLVVPPRLEPYRWTPAGRGFPLTPPAGWHNGQADLAAGGWLYGTSEEAVPLSPTRPLATMGPVRWRPDGSGAQPLRIGDGHVEGFLATANATGWVGVNMPGETALIVGPAGHAYRLPPMSEGALVETFWISPDGTTVIGNDSGPNDPATRWTCRIPS